MAKKVFKIVKIQIEAGKATAAPPIGTAFGPLGINLQDLCSRYNDATRDKMGEVIPAEVTIYEDKSFDIVLKTPPTASLLLKAAGLKKGSVKGANEVVATITKDDLRRVAEIKLPDLNTDNIENAMNTISGTARNMGIAVKGINDAELKEQGAEAAEAEAEMAKLDAELTEMQEAAKDNAKVEVETTEQSSADDDKDKDKE